MLVLGLRADSESMDDSELVFPRQHPDFTSLSQIEIPSTINFNFQGAPIEHVEKQDPIAYLRLRA